MPYDGWARTTRDQEKVQPYCTAVRAARICTWVFLLVTIGFFFGTGIWIASIFGSFTAIFAVLLWMAKRMETKVTAKIWQHQRSQGP